MADETDGLGIGEEREAPDRALHERLEALPVGRHGGRGVVPGNAVQPAGVRVRLVPAEQHPAVLGLAVDEVVRVAERGHVGGQLVTRNGAQGDVLVIDRGRRDEGADHLGDAGRPQARGVHDDLGIDGLARVDEHAANLAPRTELEPGHPRVLANPDAELARGRGERKRGAVRIEEAVAGQVDRAVQGIGRDGRQEPARLIG